MKWLRTDKQEVKVKKTEFTVYPAIDIRGGNCVRLYKGDYDKETIYDANPLEVAVKWSKLGAEFLHVIDLDGAKFGHPVNLELILEISRVAKIPVQLGGGIRDYETAIKVLETGIRRIILGSSVLKNPDFIKRILEEYSDRVVVSMDCRNGQLAVEGWVENSGVSAIDLAMVMKSYGLQRINYTDIERDGTLNGPNIEETLNFAKTTGIATIASGGVSSIKDVKKLSEYYADGIEGAIIGKALYTGAINPEELFARS